MTATALVNVWNRLHTPTAALTLASFFLHPPSLIIQSLLLPSRADPLQARCHGIQSTTWACTKLPYATCPRRRCKGSKVKVNSVFQFSINLALHRYGKLTCRMGSHSVTCHPTEVRIQPLSPAEAGTRFSDPGGMQG